MFIIALFRRLKKWLNTPQYLSRKHWLKNDGKHCWRRSSRGGDHRLTWELLLVNHMTITPPALSLETIFCPCFQSQTHFQGRSLKTAKCCWGCLDSIQDWSQFKHVYKLLRFWWVGVEFYSWCSCPRWTW